LISPAVGSGMCEGSRWKIKNSKVKGEKEKL